MQDIPFVPVIYLTRLVELMEEEGLDCDFVLRESGIARHLLQRPETLLTIGQSQQVMLNYVHLTAYPCPGIRLGKRLDLITHGLLGYVLTARCTFAELLTHICHYLQVRLPLLGLQLQREPDYVAIRVDCQTRLPEVDIFLTQTVLSSFYTLCLLITRNISLYCQPHIISDAKAAQTLLGTTPITHDRYNELRFHISQEQPSEPVADQPLEGHDQDPFREHAVVVRLRGLLLARLREAPGIDAAATLLGMSERTLRRRLADSGQTFQQIRLDVSMRAATRYLTLTRMHISRIATLVGYSDQASFSRAYQKWAGKSPDVTRRQHHQHARTQEA